MSSVIIHLVVPVLIALSLRVFAPREDLKWMWVAVAPDLDYFTWNNQIPGLPNLHRGLFHNVFILTILGGLAVWAYARFRGEDRARTLNDFLQTRSAAGWCLATYYYFTHLALDLFAGGVVPFYPFSTYTLATRFQIFVNTDTNEPAVEGQSSFIEGIPDVTPIFEWISSEETAIVTLLLVSLLGAWLLRRLARPVEVVETRRVAVASGKP